MWLFKKQIQLNKLLIKKYKVKSLLYLSLLLIYLFIYLWLYTWNEPQTEFEALVQTKLLALPPELQRLMGD